MKYYSETPNPTWIPMRMAWMVVLVMPLYLVLHGTFMSALAFYFFVSMPICLFCEWIEKQHIRW